MEQALIALAAAVLAVSAGAWAVRVRERRRVIESATIELTMLVAHVIAPISELWDGDRKPAG